LKIGSPQIPFSPYSAPSTSSAPIPSATSVVGVCTPESVPFPLAKPPLVFAFFFFFFDEEETVGGRVRIS
jgi:hypothetical protein